MEGSTSIIDLLDRGGSVFFTVEKYQRNYVWKKQQWSDLWGDILKQMKSNSNIGHYMSHIISLKTRGEDGSTIFQIVDGQQRLISTTIVCAALRNFILDEKKHDEANIASTIGEIIKSGVKEKYRIAVKKNDRAAYFAIIDNNKDKITLYSKQKNLLVQAYRYFYNEIKKVECIEDLWKAIRRLNVKLDEAGNQVEANVIFARLNSTGLNMSGGDKINSIIFEHIIKEKDDEQIDILSERVISIYDYIDSERMDSNEFFNLFLYSQGITCNPGKTVNKFNDWINENKIEKSINLIEDFLNFEKNLSETKKIVDFIKTGFDNISFKKICIDILYKYKKQKPNDTLKPDDVLEILQMCESVIVRRYFKGCTEIDCELFDTLYESAINKDGKLIDNFRTALIERLKLNKKGYTFDDKEMIEIIKKRNVKKTSGLKTILKRLNMLLYNNEKFSIEECEIEHIMPKANNDNELIYNIGNLTLLGKSANASIQDNSFPAKKVAYLDSSIRLNEYFEKISEWNDEEILKRSQYLAEKIVDLWKI